MSCLPYAARDYQKKPAPQESWDWRWSKLLPFEWFSGLESAIERFNIARELPASNPGKFRMDALGVPRSLKRPLEKG